MCIHKWTIHYHEKEISIIMRIHDHIHKVELIRMKTKRELEVDIWNSSDYIYRQRKIPNICEQFS